MQALRATSTALQAFRKVISPGMATSRLPKMMGLLPQHPWSACSVRHLSSGAKSTIVNFVCGDQTFTGKAEIGDSLLDVVVDNDLPLDGFGACEGTVACCTCHVILSKEHFERIDKVNPASEEELDMLDLAPELDDYSRLGCQVKVEKEDGPEISVQVPTVRRDARALE